MKHLALYIIGIVLVGCVNPRIEDWPSVIEAFQIIAPNEKVVYQARVYSGYGSNLKGTLCPDITYYEELGRMVLTDQSIYLFWSERLAKYDKKWDYVDLPRVTFLDDSVRGGKKTCLKIDTIYYRTFPAKLFGSENKKNRELYDMIETKLQKIREAK